MLAAAQRREHQLADQHVGWVSGDGVTTGAVFYPARPTEQYASNTIKPFLAQHWTAMR